MTWCLKSKIIHETSCVSNAGSNLVNGNPVFLTVIIKKFLHCVTLFDITGIWYHQYFHPVLDTLLSRLNPKWITGYRPQSPSTAALQALKPTHI